MADDQNPHDEMDLNEDPELALAIMLSMEQVNKIFKTVIIKAKLNSNLICDLTFL